MGTTSLSKETTTGTIGSIDFLATFFMARGLAIDAFSVATTAPPPPLEDEEEDDSEEDEEEEEVEDKDTEVGNIAVASNIIGCTTFDFAANI